MELRITNPQESWLTEQILWNNEELKAAIAEKVKDYKTIAYTEDSLKDMKADRADLNKLKKAFEDERKRVKKICMEPYTKFEQQVKEITAPYGMVLNDEIHAVELVYAGQNIAVTETETSFYNERQRVEIDLVKSLETDEAYGVGNNGEIFDVTFGLYAETDLTAAYGYPRRWSD